MTPAVYVKHYAVPQRAAAAVAHHAWLAGLDSGVRVPRLLDARAGQLTFEHLGHHHPQPSDLPVLADALGALHAAAHRSQLSGARLDQPFTTTGPSGGVLTIRDFFTPRDHVRDWLPAQPAGTSVAIYKDANLRNFLLTNTGVAVIDFDDLTLAPFGYDLAKLVVSAAMTFGAFPPELVDHALDAYNTRLEPGTGRCTRANLRSYAEVHHQLTRSYLHRNGYSHPWQQVRPWPAPTPQTPVPPGTEGARGDGRQH
jgi:aminoglycoside/choline kinase family phosphotransferase